MIKLLCIKPPLQSVWLLVLMLVYLPADAETSWQEYIEFNQSPEGQVEEPAVTLESHPIGRNTEQHLPADAVFHLWTQDETFFRPDEKDRVEIQKVLEKESKTFKLDNVVKPIPFKQGQEVITEQYVTQLKQLLDKMKQRNNLRIHFIGHTDSDQLGTATKARYGDNIGLSRSRAEATAEFFQRMLDLPAESISYDGVGDTQPLASNSTAAGKAKNRRVEVQIWYDEITEHAVEKEVIVPAPELNRIKVCRKETVCKLRYKAGNSKRAQLRNLVAPLRMKEGQAEIPAEFIRQVNEAYNNLRGKENVVIRFVGHTDSLPLTDRENRIYGDHTALSKARARRVSLAIADALKLPNTAVSSTGKGETRPVTSNSTEKGRSLNRRIEVEFWHDDPFQNFTAEAQACPEKEVAETITLTYDPPSGPVKAILLKQGQPIIPPGYTERLRKLMAEISDYAHVRLSFTGYTDNKRLSRRTAMVYGDDIGLSTARARRVMETFKSEMELSDNQVEYEGRGFVHSKDVASTGFIQFDSARVQVQIVYDELAILEEDEGLDITRIDREAIAHTPYSLNLMRISVDGEPVHDPYKSSADLQRCIDVALEKADIQFKFDNLNLQPRLNVTAWPNSVRYEDITETDEQENRVYFKIYSNYRDYIVKSEIRIYEEEQSTRDSALAVIPVDKRGYAQWLARVDDFEGPTKKLKYLLRVYDSKNNYDETRALPLWLLDNLESKAGRENIETNERRASERRASEVPESQNIEAQGVEPEETELTDAGSAEQQAAEDELASDELSEEEMEADDDEEEENEVDALVEITSGEIEKELLVGYGESHLHRQTIPLAGGTVTINGENIPENYSVWLAGRPLPVNEEGKFVSDEIFRPGLHTVEVAVLDEQGNGELFLREMELRKSDWFYVGIADMTVARDKTSGPASLVAQDETHYQNELNTDGRLAFYVDGKFENAWQLTASADTREGPINEIFSNFLEKSPDALFRRLDPDYFYPTFGDDSTIVENAPTSGNFFVKLQRQSDYGLWGNFLTQYTDTDLAQIDRGLYGAKGHYESKNVTAFGEKTYSIDAFAAEPGTISARDEYRGTGGSLYFLKRQDILTGSDRLRIEVRDKDSDIVLSVQQLVPALDYDIDYIQGRVLLSKPLSSIARDNLIVDNGSLSGNPVYLVARYEYSPGFNDLKDVAVGGRADAWLNDYIKFGVTASSQEELNSKSTLNGIDITIRKNAGTWLKIEAATSEGNGGGSTASNDGGFNFNPIASGLSADGKASAYRVDSNLRLTDLFEGVRGSATLYLQDREAGYSAPGQLTSNNIQQFGGTLNMPLTENLSLNVKGDSRDQERSLKTQNADINMAWKMDPNWKFSGGVRVDSREDNSTNIVATQKQGDRTDVALDVTYNSLNKWSVYGFAQGTANTTGNRVENNRVGTGTTIRLNDRFSVEGEVSGGDTGTGVRLGTDYLMSDRTSVYLNYTLDNERTSNGIRARKGNMATGFRSRYTDTVSIYGEERYTHGDVPTGLTHALGVDVAPNDRWTYGANVEAGTLQDQRTSAETQRLAAGLVAGYQYEELRYTGAIEYRNDIIQSPDLTEIEQTTWLLKNSFRYQVNPDWRLIGKLNYSDSKSPQQNGLYNGEFREYVLGYGYRPVLNDRWNTLFKYTYFYNIPSSGQVNTRGTANDFLQISNIVAIDTIYDISKRWSLGGKYAYRLGQVAQERDNPEFFDSRASLYVLRVDWHFVHKWDALMEYRVLDLPDAQDTRSGSLVGLNRHIGKNIKLGVGYNFTDFSDDLTDLDFNSQGVFINIVAKL
ncbi:Flagellar motor protein [hydrothermal vent metagenome]|uniref:Flagellar motor protein n=1 Tax=hydrothermal vent metagenome TaxID=652676 RepID=A0A3B0XEE8_9ZZZZ